MKHLAAIAVFAFLAGAAQPALGDGASPVVVELFTSQGCSSCPPADRYLGEIARRDDVIALSLHVDYWDRLGWRDTLANPAHTKRQLRYQRALGLRHIYTPQMVVAGMRDGIGSQRRVIRAAIADAAKANRDGPRVALVRSGPNKAVLRIGAARSKTTKTAAVWLVRYDGEHKVAIGAGENGGRRMTYHNVVRDMRRLTTWRGEATEMVLALESGGAKPGDGIVVLVQAGDGIGRILGAARLAFASRDAHSGG